MTVVADDETNVGWYVFKLGASGAEIDFLPSFTGETEVITTEFTFAEGDEWIAYVKACPNDSTTYRESEWATVEITFE